MYVLKIAKNNKKNIYVMFGTKYCTSTLTSHSTNSSLNLYLFLFIIKLIFFFYIYITYACNTTQDSNETFVQLFRNLSSCKYSDVME